MGTDPNKVRPSEYRQVYFNLQEYFILFKNDKDLYGVQKN